MKTEKNKALKYFLKKHFDFSSLKKVGFFPKEMKHTDYEGQAKRICLHFGYESIYEYANQPEIRCHISYCDGDTGMSDGRPVWVDEKGKLKTIPFVEVINPNSLHI